MFIPARDGGLDLDQLPQEQQKMLRSMNRSAQLLARCAVNLNPEELNFLRSKETGVYCAAEPVTAMQAEVAQFLNRPSGSLAKSYSQMIPPKWGLQCGASLVAACVSIQLKAEGGVHTFSHGRMACRHAWEQACLDLASGQVEAAILCSVSSHEDPIVQRRHKQMEPELTPTEGAVIAVLANSKDGLELEFKDSRVSKDQFFGIADPLMQSLWSLA